MRGGVHTIATTPRGLLMENEIDLHRFLPE